MGCASTRPVSNEVTVTQIAERTGCLDTNYVGIDDYPWSIPGSNPTPVRHNTSLGVVQVKGTPNQFTYCADCPCPTQKSPVEANTIASRNETSTKIKKVSIHFNHASFALSERERQILTRFYQTLPNDYRLAITGYTDDTTPGGTITNESLARKRAQTVFDYLISLGLEEDTATIDSAPLCCYIAPNSTDTGRALNRRAEIVMTSTSTHR